MSNVRTVLREIAIGWAILLAFIVFVIVESSRRAFAWLEGRR